MSQKAKNEFQKGLGLRIKKIREAHGLSQEELASRFGAHRVAVTQIESGQREVSARELSLIAETFGLSTDVLLDLKKDYEVVIEKAVQQEPKAAETPMRISVPQKKMDKFREVLLYVLNRIGSRPNLGETVLYKLLYFIDFDFYEKYEEQLIGATYIKNKFGPTPVEFAKIRDSLVDDGDLTQVKAQWAGYDQKKYLPNREADLSRISAREIKLIDDVIEKLGHMSARQISEYSHGDIPWITTEEQKPIAYEAVFYRTPQYSVRDYTDVKDGL